MTPAEQRAAALDAANQIRIDRAKLRLRIKAGDVQASRILEEMPECIRGAAVFHFLTYMPDIGKASSNGSRSASKAFAMLRKTQVPGHKRLDQLTPAQHARLFAAVLEREEKRHPAERNLS